MTADGENFSEASPELFSHIMECLRGEELPRFSALYLVASGTIPGVHTGKTIVTFPPNGPLSRCLSDALGGQASRAILIDTEQCKAWVAPLGDAIRDVFALNALTAE